MDPVKAQSPDVINPPVCPACGGKMGGKYFICEPCWLAAPGNERAALHGMFERRQDCRSKVAKLVRILRKKREKASRAHSPDTARHNAMLAGRTGGL